MKSKTFEPPIRTLMGPGPSDVSQRVLNAMAKNTIGHLDPSFVSMMDDTKNLLRYAFQTKNELTFAVSGLKKSLSVVNINCSFSLNNKSPALI